MAVYRPKRAAAISTKSYKEPDTDDSLSDVTDSLTRKREVGYTYSIFKHAYIYLLLNVSK